MSTLSEWASIVIKSFNLAQNIGVSDDKIAAVKNVQNYDDVVEDVNYDSENEEWDNENLPQMIVHNSNYNSNEEINTKSDVNKDLGV